MDAREHTSPPAAASSHAHDLTASKGATLTSVVSKYGVQYTIPAHLAPAALQVCITAFPLGLLAGLVLPRALHFLVSACYSWAWTEKEATAGMVAWYGMPQLHLYLLAWCTFHLLEFVITAAYNPTRLYSDSFLLNNGIAYHVAHIAGLLEFVATATFLRPEWKQPGWSTLVGLALVVGGQAIRSLAMIHAHNNFSHIVAFKKREDHQLIKTGVYSRVGMIIVPRFTRHPSYFGFFYWALGTQILLGNVAGCIAFAVVLWRFFAHRIRIEEQHLIEFFKDEYIEYKSQVGVYLPFIK